MREKAMWDRGYFRATSVGGRSIRKRLARISSTAVEPMTAPNTVSDQRTRGFLENTFSAEFYKKGTFLPALTPMGGFGYVRMAWLTSPGTSPRRSRRLSGRPRPYPCPTCSRKRSKARSWLESIRGPTSPSRACAAIILCAAVPWRYQLSQRIHFTFQ